MSAANPVSIFFDQSAAVVVDMLEDILKRGSEIRADGENYRRDNEVRLLFEGLTFVVAARPLSATDFAFQRIFFSGATESMQCGLDLRFGQNLDGGLKVPALCRGYLQFAAKLAERLSAPAVAANEAGLLVDAQYFAESVETFVRGGAFPALALIRLATAADGDSIQTKGLQPYSGQEVLFRGSGLPPAEMAKRLVRLIHDIAINGRVMDAQTIGDLHAGASITLEPVENGSLLVATVHFGPDSDFV